MRDAKSHIRKSRRRYVLFMLTGVSALNFLDRQILVILQESIKSELALSDTQLGLMTGFAFSIFYVVMGIPIARLADRVNRKNIIAVCLAGWSLMTLLSGLVHNFIQLLVARIGVGIGEAGGAPPSHALISDYFPAGQRSWALSIFSIGVYIGVVLGLLVGGVIDHFFGWRMAFIIAALPGLLFALIIYLTVDEVQRGAQDSDAVRGDVKSFRQTILYIFGHQTFIYLALGGAFVAFVQYGIGNWIPPFLSRYHALNSLEIGIMTALIIGVGGALGTYAGGVLGDSLSKRDLRWYFWVPSIGMIISLPFIFAFAFTSSLWITAMLLLAPVTLTALYLAPSLAVAHNLVPSHMRALSSALFFFILNLIGLGLGPLCVGALSDLFDTTIGEDALRWAIALSGMVGIIGALCYLLAARTIRREWKLQPDDLMKKA